MPKKKARSAKQSKKAVDSKIRIREKKTAKSKGLYVSHIKKMKEDRLIRGIFIGGLAVALLYAILIILD